MADDVVVGANAPVRIEVVKSYLTMAVNFLHMAKSLLPADRAQWVSTVANKVERVVASDWFAGMLVFFINEFGDTEPTQTEVVSALNKYSVELQTKGMSAPPTE